MFFSVFLLQLLLLGRDTIEKKMENKESGGLLLISESTNKKIEVYPDWILTT